MSLWCGFSPGGLLVMLLLPMNANSSIFSTNYTLSLLMPVMLWGAMRFGYKLMSLIWTPVLLVSIHFFYHYIPVQEGMAFSWRSPHPAIWSFPSL